MKIYTRTGDQGQTSLISGQRVAKNDARIEAYGTVDELNACIGLIRDAAEEEEPQALLRQIQDQLFAIGSQLAAGDNNKYPLPPIRSEVTEELERAIDQMNEELPELRNFILPGGDPAASFCHLARTVCRRAERRSLDLALEAALEAQLVPFLNRLSDYLFVLARFYTKRHSGQESLWKPNK